MIPGTSNPDNDPLEELTKVLVKVAQDIEALSDRVHYAEAALHHPEIVTAAPLRCRRA